MNEYPKKLAIHTAVLATACTLLLFVVGTTLLRDVAALQSKLFAASTGLQGEDKPLGGLIHNTQESFDAGLAVNGTSFVDSSRNVSSTNLYVSGSLTGNAMAKVATTLSSSTTTAAYFLNSSGKTRIVTGAGVVDLGTAASVGSITWTAGTSSYPGVSPAYTKVLSTVLTRVNGVDVITTTSTAQTAYSTWKSGEYFVVNSSTTTNSGQAFVTYLAP